ncbi:MAG: hypothetical protein AAFV25_26925, partial [Bacteroidota bacterium]
MKKMLFLGFFVIHFAIILVTCLLSLQTYQKESVMKQLNEPAAILMKNMKKFMPSADDVIPPLLQKYSLYAFSNRGYGFFSPNVPS